MKPIELILVIIWSWTRISSAETDSECVFEYSSTLISQGEVVSPNYPSPYPNNLNCRYEFYARDNERVIIQVDDFELEAAQNTAVQEINFMDFIETVTRPPSRTNDNHPTDSTSERDESSLGKQCFYDFLDVFSSDGIGHLYWMARYCGRDIQPQIVSTSPTLILVFKTDRMLGFRGFKLRFHFSYLNILPFVTDAERCGHAEIVGNGSILGSPNYPRPYPDHIDCAWTITVEKDKKILIKFIDVNFGVESCSQSYVSIWDGYVSDVLKPQFTVCQKLVYYHKGVMKFESKSNRIVIKFVGNRNLGSETQDEDLYWSNGSRKVDKPEEIKTGFFFSWTAVNSEDECSPNDFQCEGGEYCIDSKNFLCQQTQRYCLSKSLVCDGVLNCDVGDDSDEKNCELSYLKSKNYLLATSISLAAFLLITIVYCMLRFWKKKFEIESANGAQKDGKFTEGQLIERGLKSMPVPQFIEFNPKCPRPPSQDDQPPVGMAMSSSSTIQSESEQENSIMSRRKSTPTRTPTRTPVKQEKAKKSRRIQECDEEIVDEEELENEVALIRREYRVKQLIDETIKKPPPVYYSQKNSVSTRLSTPTYSSSLPSENSLPSPGPIVNDVFQHQASPKVTSSARYSIPHQMSNASQVVVMSNGSTTSRLGDRLKSHIDDDLNNSLRRNSYTKAIFYDNNL